MIGFLIGLVVGGIFGVIVMALMSAASYADKQLERHTKHSADTNVHPADTAMSST